jgi:uncharacterized protein YjiS (DUF1127 family)
MPSADLFLPPQSYSVWLPRRIDDERSSSLWTRLAALVRRARERRALADLDDRMLHDIGITRVEAIREAEKPFWK